MRGLLVRILFRMCKDSFKAKVHSKRVLCLPTTKKI